MSEPRPMAFRRYGRSYHLVIDSAEDLDQILRLDEALWVATGAPLESINCINGLSGMSHGQYCPLDTKSGHLSRFSPV